MNIIEIIPTQEEHLDRIAQIESACFSTPWSRKSFADGLATPNLQTYFTATTENEVIGYICLFHLFEEGELLNIAVDPRYRRLGVGQALIDKMIDYLRTKEIERITLEVRQSNISAQNLYVKNGFKPISIRRNYYTAPSEDGIVMERKLERTV